MSPDYKWRGSCLTTGRERGWLRGRLLIHPVRLEVLYLPGARIGLARHSPDSRVHHEYASNSTQAYVHLENLNPAFSSLIFNVLEVKVSDATNNFGTSTYKVSDNASEQKLPKGITYDGSWSRLPLKPHGWGLRACWEKLIASDMDEKLMTQKT